MGATKKTENSHLEEKVRLRLDAIKDMTSPVHILDAFAADGRIWRNVKKRTSKQLIITPIEAREIPGKVYMKGDNLKFLKCMDLTRFDLIDLDHYGVPFAQIETLFQRRYKGVVCVTFIQTMSGRLPNRLLNALGFTLEMVKQCPTLFSRNGMEKMEQFLAARGVKKIKGYFFENRKNYFYFMLG